MPQAIDESVNSVETKFQLLKNGSDFVILKCNTCAEIFYSSPCGEENVEWDEVRRCLLSSCPNKCHAPGVRSE